MSLRLFSGSSGNQRCLLGLAEERKVALERSSARPVPAQLKHLETARGNLVDDDLRRAERLIFHPNINTASLTLTAGDFERFLAARGNSVRFVRVANP